MLEVRRQKNALRCHIVSEKVSRVDSPSFTSFQPD